MQSFKSWSIEAIKPLKRPDNPIFDEKTAAACGFRGILVPGSTLFAYLTHPAVTRWGEAWLDRGQASIAIQRPFYEGELVTVAPKADGPESYACELRAGSSEVRATGTACLPEAPPAAPLQRGDRVLDDTTDRPWASRPALEKLRDEGMGVVRVGWRAEPPFDRYTELLDEMPSAIRPDQRALANGAFIVSLANRALLGNLRMGPWIHVESEVQNYGRLHLGRTVLLESSILDLFERSGHEFCDLQVNAFLKEGPPIAAIRHRVIYRLRQAS